MAQSRSRAAIRTVLRTAFDVLQLLSTAVRSHTYLAAENLFLRKQLALYVERQVQPRRADNGTRIALVALSRLIDWRRILTVVKPDTLIRWHRKGCNRGRPHASLGPGLPEPPPGPQGPEPCGHRLPARHRVVATPILSGLRHEYRLDREAA